MSSKLNWLMEHTLPGSLVLQPWLTQHGIGYSLAQKYAASGWLSKLAPGVYVRPVAGSTPQPNWADAMQSLTEQLNLPVHLAGLSSLAQQGLSHYLSLGQEAVWVGVRNRQSLPKWFRELPGQEWRYCGNTKLTDLTADDFTLLTVEGRKVKASKPELAAYEVADAAGDYLSFEHAAELFQGLVNLSPRKVQALLERSRAVQTNRVFLFLSHYCGHQWTKRLDESQLTLGSGKRQVVPNGRYDERYQITVPRSLGPTEQAEHG
ncbi:MAG: type IV toxin-antitoxin system AbiEi family antitoxin domain-containing protein [Pseudomonadaceae bacterium]